MKDRCAREILVKLREFPAALDAASLDASGRVTALRPALPLRERSAELAKVIVLETVSGQAARDVCAALQHDSRIEWAELRPERTTDILQAERTTRLPLDAPPNDPYYGEQWWLDQIEAPAAWDVVAPDASILVAIVDDGVNFNLDELAGARWENAAERDGVSGVDDDGNGYTDDLFGYDFIELDGDPLPAPLDGFNSHGTHVAGIAAAARNNRLGIAGVAGGARVMGVRVGQGGSIPYGFEGVYYACVNGARVINCSWGGSTESAYEREVMRYVRARGCVVVASAGNNGSSVPRYPAAIEGVLSVAATTAANTAAAFTNYGPWVKIAAPGVHILSVIFDGSYAAWQGTSMAAPVVTAVCGMLIKRFPDWTSEQVLTAICTSADPIDTVNDTLPGWLGLGRVNAYRAVSNFEIPVGVRLTDVRFHENIGDGDNRIEADEVALLDVELSNEHGRLNGLHGTVTSLDGNITISPAELVYPPIVEAGRYWSEILDPRVHMSSAVTRGAVLPLAVEWADGTGRIVGRGTTTVLLDTTFVTIETSALRFGLGEQGALGYFDYVRGIPLGPGLALTAGPSNALYHGSIFVAADGRIADNFYGDSTGSRFDWSALPGAYAERFTSDRAPIAVRSSFDDRAMPEQDRVGAEVTSELFAWPDIPDGMILEITVTNRGSSIWSTAQAGVMLDWDIGPSSRNLGSYSANDGILEAHSTLSWLPYVGVAGLSGELETAYEVSNRDEFESGGFRDARLVEILGAGVGGFSSTARDLSHIAGLTLPTLPPAASATVRMALLTGQSAANLANVLDQLRTRSGDIRKSPDETVHLARKSVTVAPNPLGSGQPLEIRGLDDASSELRLYNVLGQEVARLVLPHATKLNIPASDLQHLAPGLLFYHLEQPGRIATGKLLYLP
ncbi:MAG: S8 family peptidase [bacterium]|nr:S8 family peptidase [bacterium]